jgi:hypothetical protein
MFCTFIWRKLSESGFSGFLDFLGFLPVVAYSDFGQNALRKQKIVHSFATNSTN